MTDVKEMENEDSWIESEFEDLDFGDKRVNATGKIIINTLAKQPRSSIPKAFNTWSETKSCYEFFYNGKVTAEKILEPHRKATINRINQEPIILLPTDTSSLNYTSKPSMEDLGNISNKNMGLFIHPLLAITPERINLGIVDAKIWARESKTEGLTNHEIYCLPIEQKEKYRWIESYMAACEVAKECPNTQVIAITDREGDFAELFEAVIKAKKQKKYADIIVRSYHDRTLVTSDNDMKEIREDQQKKLMGNLKASKSQGQIHFKIPKTQNRPERIVTQTIKAAPVTFRKRYEKSQKITVNAIMAIEENPAEGVEPLIWVFLTTLPINSFEQITLIIKYYLARWEIEVFFKILKSGCSIEDRRIKACTSLTSLISIFLVITWRIMFVMKLGRECPEMPCDIVFSESEWKSVHKITKRDIPLPDKPPSLGDFIRMIAKLGGYLDRKNDPPPGPKAMWIGINRMYDFSIAWEIFGN